MEEQLLYIQRDINCLLDEDRNTRKQGLTKLAEYFKQFTNEKSILFEKYVLRNLLRALEDKIEKHREIAYVILHGYLKFSSELKLEIFEAIVKTLISRLNQIPYPESSEEIRLTVVKTLNQIVTRIPQAFIPVLAEYSNMLYKALTDQFPEMKRSTSLLCIDSTDQLGKFMGGYLSNTVKQLTLNMQHQHSKVRSVSVQALAHILLCEGAGSFLELALPTLKQTTLDKASDVRKQAFQAISKLLQGFSIANLTLFENHLFILLLNGLSDEQEDIRNLTVQQIQEIGWKRQQLDQEISNS